MAYASGNCPHCGVKFNYVQSSVGTVRRCEACGNKFIVPEVPSIGCGAILVAILVVIIGGGALVFAACAGLAFLASIAEPVAPAPVVRKDAPASEAPKTEEPSTPAAEPPKPGITSTPFDSPEPPKEPSQEVNPVDAGNARRWTDATGKFSTDAEFGGMIGTTVTLHKTDGTTIKIDLDKLSDSDREWIEARHRAKKASPAARSADTRSIAARPANAKWYEGGTLHKAKMKEWSEASHANKLATASDFVVTMLKKDGVDVESLDLDKTVRPAAADLVKGLDAANKDGVADNQDVSEIAAVIFVLMKTNQR